MKTLIYDTLISLASQEPEQHARIRQNLYEQLDLPFDKQLALYSCALGLRVQVSLRAVKVSTTLWIAPLNFWKHQNANLLRCLYHGPIPQGPFLFLRFLNTLFDANSFSPNVI